MNERYLYRAKDVLTGEWVYGNIVDRTIGCVPIIVSNAWMQDNGDVIFDYHHIDKDTLQIARKYKPRYIREKVYYCPPDFGGEEFDEWGEVPRCPSCSNKFRELERPNFCPKCGLFLDWT